jgi:hypothetical protein
MLSTQLSNTTKKYNKVDISSLVFLSLTLLIQGFAFQFPNMASTSKTLSRIPKKVRNPKNPAIYSSEDIYAINDDDDWPALGQSPNDSIAVIPNYTADQGFPEQWESDPNFFDEFIDKDAWEDPVVEMENDNSKEAEAPTVDKSAIVLNGLNASYCLDSINAGHMPPDSTGDSASPFLAENTLCNSGEVPGSIGRGACNPDRTGLTFGHGQHKAEEQQLEKTFATTGSHDTSKTNSSIGTGETYLRNSVGNY